MTDEANESTQTSSRAPASTGATMGLFVAICLVTGNMIGSGVFFLPRDLAPFGWIAIAAWVVTGAGSMLLALTFARLGTAYPATGGPYVYVREAFGGSFGFMVAWGYWLTIVVSNAAVVVATVEFASFFWDDLETNTALRIVVQLAIVWLLTAVAANGVRSSGSVAVVTTIVKLIPLLAVAIVGLFVGDWSSIEANPSGESAFSALGSAAALTLFAFIGLESATVPAGSLRPPPGRTLSLSTVIGTGIAVVVYIAGTLAVFGQLSPDELARSANPFGDAADSIFGGAGGDIVAAGAVVSALGTLNGFILLQGQMPLAAAKDNLFPRRFERQSSKGVPMFGLVLSSVISSACVIVAETSDDGFERLVLLTTVTALVPYVLSAAAQLTLIKTDPSKFVPAALTRDLLIGGLAFVYSAWTIWGAGSDAVYYSFILLILGLPLLIRMKWQSRNGAAG